MSQFYANLQIQCELVSKESGLTVLGDLNSDPTKPPSVISSRYLNSVYKELNLHNLVSLPTRVNRTSASVIDLILTTRPTYFDNVGIFTSSVSDHRIVCCSHLPRGIREAGNMAKYVKVRSFMKLYD